MRYLIPVTAVALAALLLFAVPVVAGPGPTLLAFKAKWCGPCQRMEPTLKKLEAKGYRVVRIDVDTKEGKALADRYKVQALPTYLVLKKDGTVAARHEGMATEGKLLGLLRLARLIVRGLLWLLL